MHLLMTEFDHPQVTLCGWQDIKIHLLTNLQSTILLVADSYWLFCYKLQLWGSSLFLLAFCINFG